MATEQQLQARLDQLNEIMANGIKSTGTGDKRAEFRDLNEVRQAITVVQGQLAAAQGKSTRRTYRFIANKDL
jgi:uncharacterized protein YoaH (UPF0181 family)